MKTQSQPFTNRRYLDAIADHVIIFDGAMGTSVQAYDLTFPRTLAASDSRIALTTCP